MTATCWQAEERNADGRHAMTCCLACCFLAAIMQCALQDWLTDILGVHSAEPTAKH